MSFENYRINVVLGYMIYIIHLLLTIIINFGWLFVTNIFYLRVIVFIQVIIILSWNTFCGNCLITMIENYLLEYTTNNTQCESITTKLLSRYFPPHIIEITLLWIIMISLFFTLIKIICVKPDEFQ